MRGLGHFTLAINRYSIEACGGLWDDVQFAKMDLGRWPRIAKELNVSLSGTSKQLPTLIMYENGRECARIPHIFADGSVAKGRYRKVRSVPAPWSFNGRSGAHHAVRAEQTERAGGCRVGCRRTW